MSGESKIGALILAAGLSRRMGTFKPLLPLGEVTVIEQTVLSVLSGGAESAVVVTGHRADEVEALLRRRFGDRVRFIRNPDFSTTDMLCSVRLGAAILPDCEAFFLLPGDMPAVSPETFRALLDARRRQGGLLVFPTSSGRRTHPPLVDAALIPEILSFRGGDGLRGLWRAHEGDSVFVPVPDPGVTLDLDTPEDYERCKKLMKI